MKVVLGIFCLAAVVASIIVSYHSWAKMTLPGGSGTATKRSAAVLWARRDQLTPDELRARRRYIVSQFVLYGILIGGLLVGLLLSFFH